MRIKELERSRSPGKAGKKSKMSLKQEKEFKAQQKHKQEVNFKIRRADKNLRIFFEEVKAVLSKPDEDYVISGLNF